MKLTWIATFSGVLHCALRTHSAIWPWEQVSVNRDMWHNRNVVTTARKLRHISIIFYFFSSLNTILYTKQFGESTEILTAVLLKIKFSWIVSLVWWIAGFVLRDKQVVRKNASWYCATFFRVLHICCTHIRHDDLIILTAILSSPGILLFCDSEKAILMPSQPTFCISLSRCNQPPSATVSNVSTWLSICFSL